MNPDGERALKDALVLAEAQDWQACQTACDALTKSDDPRLATVARLNVMICQYQLGFDAQVLSADLVHLLDQLPSAARPSCLCVATLAAHRLGRSEICKLFVMILARWEMEPMDLPATPLFVMLGGDEQACQIAEAADSGPMIDIVDELMKIYQLDSDELRALDSLAEAYRARAAVVEALPQRVH